MCCCSASKSEVNGDVKDPVCGMRVDLKVSAGTASLPERATTYSDSAATAGSMPRPRNLRLSPPRTPEFVLRERAAIAVKVTPDLGQRPCKPPTDDN